MKVNNFLLLCILLLFVSCMNSSSVSTKEYMKYVLATDNGLNKEQDVNGMLYQVQYMPTEFMAITDNELIKTDSIKERIKDYEDLVYFKLIITPNTDNSKQMFAEMKSNENYNKLLQFSNIEFPSSIKLVCGKDTNSCVMSYFETGMKLSNKLIYLCAFPKGLVNDDLKVRFDDRVFNNGLIYFTITKEDIDKLKEIKIV